MISHSGFAHWALKVIVPWTKRIPLKPGANQRISHEKCSKVPFKLTVEFVAEKIG